MTSPVIIAGDVGATHTRIAVCSTDHPAPTLSDCETFTGPGYNVRSSGTAGRHGFFETINRAIDSLASAPSATDTTPTVAATVIGMSGAGPARHADIERDVLDGIEVAFASRSVTFDRSRAAVSEDLLTAFVSGLDAAHDGTGILLLAGSGAGAVRYHHRQEERRIDAMGWLLGDVGSGVWLGRKALEAAAADLDQRGPATSLTAAVLTALGIDHEDGNPLDIRQRLIAAAYDLTPSQWGSLAPHVSALADPHTDSADAVAKSLAAEAVEALLNHVAALSEGSDRPLPVVLAGSVVTAEGPIARVVQYALERDGHDVRTADAPLAGALTLARDAA